ncbi:hypothetical protein FS837_006734, partial [Tulasnella sp. UAMH 9824]
MSTLLSRISNLSFETVKVASGKEDGGLSGLLDGATGLEASERSLGESANHDDVAQGDNLSLVENNRLPREVAEENVRVDYEQTEKQRIVYAQGDKRSTLLNAYLEEEKVVEENVSVGQDEVAMKGVNSDEQTNQ